MSATKLCEIPRGVLSCTAAAKKGITLTVNTREIPVFNITKDDIEYLRSLMALAHPKDDSTSQNSKFIKSFDLNLNVLGCMKTILKIDGMVIKPCQLNLYSEGSSCTETTVTKRLDGLAGTLFVVLPTKFAGGELHFGDYNLESGMPKIELRFIYLEVGLTHTVAKIEKGDRVTLAYDVFHTADDHAKSLFNAKICTTKTSPAIYQKILEEAVAFCTDKKNILFGPSKHSGNDVFDMLLKDLRQKFAVIDVVIEKNLYGYDDNGWCKVDKIIPNDILRVKKVYTVDEENPIEAEGNKHEWLELAELSNGSFKVAHILFPSASKLNEQHVQGLKFAGDWFCSGGWKKPYMMECQVECYGAYMINPSKDDGYGSDDESDNSPTDVDEESVSDDDESPLPKPKKRRNRAFDFCF